MLKFLLVVAVFALCTYLAVRAIERRNLLAGGDSSAPTPPRRPLRPQPPKTVAPDDDEDFLRDLDRRRLNPDDPESRDSRE